MALRIFVVAMSLLAVAVGGFYYFEDKAGQGDPVACTQEAKLCPDGSAVGRTGPNCEFAACPVVSAEPATIKGKVSVGPICPVERAGVPCPTPPEAYTSRSVILYAADGVTMVKEMHFTNDGTYSFSVPVGTYVLSTPRQGIGGAKDLPKTVNVKSGETLEVDFSIDTGIR